MTTTPQNDDALQKAARRNKLARRLAPFVIAIIVLDLLLLASCSQSAADAPCFGCVNAEAASPAVS